LVKVHQKFIKCFDEKFLGKVLELDKWAKVANSPILAKDLKEMRGFCNDLQCCVEEKDSHEIDEMKMPNLAFMGLAREAGEYPGEVKDSNDANQANDMDSPGKSPKRRLNKPLEQLRLEKQGTRREPRGGDKALLRSPTKNRGA
jgi:hypothetical protein